MPFSPLVERWRGSVARNFPGNEVDNALYVMDKESGGNPLVINPTSGAAGLFQILLSAHPDISYEQAIDAETNIAYAGKLFRDQGWTPWAWFTPTYSAPTLSPSMSKIEYTRAFYDSSAITGRYGDTGSLWPTGHTGTDFAHDLGSPVPVILGGKVVNVQYDSGTKQGLGNAVYIETKVGEDTALIVYGHLLFTTEFPAPKVGEKIEAGTIIGGVGETGYAFGPHTHIEILKNGERSDPEEIIGNLIEISDKLAGLGKGFLDQLADIPADITSLLGDAGKLLDPWGLRDYIVKFVNMFLDLGKALLKLLQWLGKSENWYRILFIGAGMSIIALGISTFMSQTERGKQAIDVGVMLAKSSAMKGAAP